jgi:chromosomal replication initiation ATPase DnaA
MSLAEEMHAAHKARLVRLGSVPQGQTVPKELLDKQSQQLLELQARIERQKDVISELNSTITRQLSIIRKFADESESPTPRIADVIAVVAEQYNLTRQMLTGAQRSSNIVFPRQVGYYICRDLGFGWVAIGRCFLKDHTSALHGARQIAIRLLRERELAAEIETIKTKLDLYVTKRIEASKAMLA